MARTPNNLNDVRGLIPPTMPGRELVEKYLQGLGQGSRRTLAHGLLSFAKVFEESRAGGTSQPSEAGKPVAASTSTTQAGSAHTPGTDGTSRGRGTSGTGGGDISESDGTSGGGVSGGGAGGWDWGLLTPEQVRRVRGILAERYAAGTVNKCMAGLRGLLRVYLLHKRITPGQYQALAQVGPVSDHTRKPSRTLTARQISRLYETCARDITASGARDAALLTILLAGGLRSLEVTELDRADVEPGRFLVRSPVPQVQRWVPLTPQAAEQLRPWLELRGDASGPLLCPVDKGGTIHLRRLTSTALLGMLIRRSKEARITPAITTRDLRRTCIVNLIARGLNLEQVRAHAGHLSWLTPGAFAQLAQETGLVHKQDRSSTSPINPRSDS